MAELPIKCPDCDRKHWSVASMMICDCDQIDSNGYEKAPASNDRG